MISLIPLNNNLFFYFFFNNILNIIFITTFKFFILFKKIWLIKNKNFFLKNKHKNFFSYSYIFLTSNQLIPVKIFLNSLIFNIKNNRNKFICNLLLINNTKISVFFFLNIFFKNIFFFFYNLNIFFFFLQFFKKNYFIKINLFNFKLLAYNKKINIFTNYLTDF